MRRLDGLIRYGLGGLLAFGALNAIGGGVYGVSGAEGVPVELLDGSPFETYFVPSLILLVVVGGSLLWASVAVFVRARVARASALGAGAILLGWIAAQVSIIGYASWMQPATAIAGILVVLMAARLPSA